MQLQFWKRGREDNKKGLLLRGYITVKIDLDHKMRCWRNGKEEQKGEEGKMDQFGIQQCEREEGDGSSSAFTLVLPKDNQGRSRYVSYCVKKKELSCPRRVKVDPGRIVFCQRELTQMIGMECLYPPWWYMMKWVYVTFLFTPKSVEDPCRSRKMSTF